MREELVTQMNSIVNQGLFTIDAISGANYKPHPYTIGSKHLEYNDSMYLGEAEIIEMERKHGPMCAFPRCTTPYKEHTSDTVAFVKLRANVTREKLSTELKKIVDLCTQNHIDGFAFLETEQKFRVI